MRVFLQTSVTSSLGDDSTGTLSSAIDTVNATPSTGPIQIISGVTPTLTTSPFDTITTNMTIESDVSGNSRTINGNNVTAGINITGGAATLSSDIMLENADISVVGSGGFLTYSGPNNWINGPSVTLQEGTLYVSLGTSFPVLPGNIYLAEVGIIAATSGPYNGVFSGQISEITANSILTINNLNPFLDNRTSANNWTGGTNLINSDLTVNTSASFPSTGNIYLDNSELIFSLASSDTYTGSGTIEGVGSFGELGINSGTINLLGSIMDISSIYCYGGIVNLSGSITNVTQIVANSGRLTLANTVTNSQLTINNGTMILSGANASNSLIINMEDGTGRLELLSSIGSGSSLFIDLATATIQVSADVTMNTQSTIDSSTLAFFS